MNPRSGRRERQHLDVYTSRTTRNDKLKTDPRTLDRTGDAALTNGVARKAS
jgi:hypothetical protein